MKPSYMVFPILLSEKYKKFKVPFINHIESLGLETRPIISGSFTNQPSSKLYKLNSSKKYIGAEKVQKNGFYWIYNRKLIRSNKIFRITLFSINRF